MRIFNLVYLHKITKINETRRMDEWMNKYLSMLFYLLEKPSQPADDFNDGIMI